MSGEGGGRPRVLVAMSGGVDSSAALELLLREGYEVAGITMRLCGSGGAAEDARRTCERFGVPHQTVDLRDRFEESVISPFCESYAAGLTPNPCVECNRALKFGELHRIRERLGFDYLATGHYARTAFDGVRGRWQLLRGLDRAKDQSYFLYNLTQDQLARTLFPLGGMRKADVRSLARQLGIPAAEQPESQDICFIPDGDHVAFLKRRLGEDAPCFRPGPIIGADGRPLGTHQGLAAYTSGQRKGIGVAAPEPLYVMGKRPAANELVVGTAGEAACTAIVIADVNMVATASFDSSVEVAVKTHYRQRPVPATVHLEPGNRLRIDFASPQRPSAPGQSAVIYAGEAVLAGGVIIESA